MFLQNLSGVIGHIQAGKLRALAVTHKERVPSLPEVPTLTELGHPKMELIVGWSGLWGPKKLPEPVTGKWENVLQSLKGDAEWVKMTEGLGSIPMIMGPVDTKAFVETQYNAFQEVTDRLGLTIK